MDAIERHDGETAPLKEVGKHRLGGHELGEDQHLQGRVVLLALLLLNAFEQRFSLDVRTAGFAAARGRQQELDLLALVLEALQARLQDGVELLLTIQRGPVLPHILGEQGKLALGQFEHRKSVVPGLCGSQRCSR